MVRKKLLLFLILLLFTFNFLGALNLNTAKVSAGEYPAIYIEPAAIVDPTLTPGSNFTISIKTNYTGEDITAWQFILYYNPDVLHGGKNQTDTWAGDGTKTEFRLSQRMIIPGSAKVYMNQTLMPNVTQTTDTWTGDGTKTEFNTTITPVFAESETVYVNETTMTKVTGKTDTWTGDGTTTTFTTTGKPIVKGSEEVYVNFTDTWTGTGTQTTFYTTEKPIVEGSEKVYVNQTIMTKVTGKTDTWTGDGTTTTFYTTGKPFVEGSEKVYVNGTLMTKDEEYTINYITGAINFTTVPGAGAEIEATYQYGQYTITYTTGTITFITAPGAGAQIKATYWASMLRDTDYTIDYITGNITFTTAPGVDATIEATYEYGHYTIDYPAGAITFRTAPSAGANIKATYQHPYYFVDYRRFKLTFTIAPGVGAEIKAIYLWGGIDNGDLISYSKDTSAKFKRGTFNNEAGKLSLTSAYFEFFEEPAPLTYGPGTLAYITFTVVGTGYSNITLGPETQLIGYTEGGYGSAYLIIDGETMPNHIQHGYFDNTPLPGAIAGTVTDASTGDPIEGATVEAMGPETRSTTTDEYGNYLIADVLPGSYMVTASAVGYCSDSKPATVESEKTKTVNFALQPIVGWIDGYVTDNATTLPIANAIVTADTVASNTTNDAGYYKIEIVPGTYNLTASMSGYYDDVVYDVSVSANAIVNINFTLEPISVFGWINGTVTDASTGSAIVGARVTADTVASGFTNETGHYSILVPAPENYTVIASASGYYSSPPVTGIFVGINATQIVNFELNPLPGAISGTVTDNATPPKPIEGATVTADGYSATTDADGHYNVTVAPGTYTVTASATGYESTSKPATVESEKTKTVNFALQPIVGWINGTVTDALTEDPIYNATVTAAGYSTTTDLDGEYTIPADLLPGNYTVEASKTGYISNSTFATVTGGTTTTVNLALTPLPGAIDGTVTDASTGDPIEGATVTVNGYSATTDADGHYNVTVAPGTYTVTASATGYESTSKPATVESEKTKTVNFTLRVSSTITISADPTTITVGEDTTISGSIDPTREGVTVTIWYRLSGEEAWTNLTTVTTNEYSQYSHVWTPETAGTYEVKASWLGDENTSPAESDEETITVQERPSGVPWYLYIVAAGVAAIIIAVAFYFLRIKKPKPT